MLWIKVKLWKNIFLLIKKLKKWETIHIKTLKLFSKKKKQKTYALNFEKNGCGLDFAELMYIWFV